MELWLVSKTESFCLFVHYVKNMSSWWWSIVLGLLAAETRTVYFGKVVCVCLVRRVAFPRLGFTPDLFDPIDPDVTPLRRLEPFIVVFNVTQVT